MERHSLPLNLVKHIKRSVKTIYPKMRLGDCYKINSSVGYFLNNLGYDMGIMQGYASLDRQIYDPILKENRPETKGITQRPDHIFLRVKFKTLTYGSIYQIYDFADKVFGKAKIVHYSYYDDLFGKENKKLTQLLKKDWK